MLFGKNKSGPDPEPIVPPPPKVLVDDWVGKWVTVSTSVPVINPDMRTIIGRLVRRMPDGLLLDLNGTLHIVSLSYVACVSLPKNQDEFTLRAMEMASQQT